MRMWAIFLPPVAMFLCGKPVQAIIALVMMLTVIGWPIASIWALSIVGDRNADKRTARQIRAVERAARQ
jgi:uncharacterized membrane protein YqaE (UPF0057 family)